MVPLILGNPHLGFRVYGLGFGEGRGWPGGLGFRVWGLGFRV